MVLYMGKLNQTKKKTEFIVLHELKPSDACFCPNNHNKVVDNYHGDMGKLAWLLPSVADSNYAWDRNGCFASSLVVVAFLHK